MALDFIAVIFRMLQSIVQGNIEKERDLKQEITTFILVDTCEAFINLIHEDHVDFESDRYKWVETYWRSRFFELVLLKWKALNFVMRQFFFPPGKNCQENSPNAKLQI
jgi:hypothetical protein